MPQLILETGMSECFNSPPLHRQRGMTLLEMMMVIAIIGLLASLVVSSPQFLGRAPIANWNAKRDFVGWFAQVRRNALYTSTSGRVCLVGQKIVVQYYRPDAGWQESHVFYQPPSGINLSWQQQDCSPEFTRNADDFIAQISFQHTT